ncbi:alpha/beta hydrolase [Salininema proteolyticum]|uniref:Alpha/beta hydrolase n=1 Tax=Salininema proteolyticum TaxID=1607685 RepID=A0ABV8TV85_9ACTN
MGISSEPFVFDAGAEAEATVLLCHGFTGDPASMRPWGEHLRDEGFHVVAPILPGHGRSWRELAGTGWDQWFAELVDALEKAESFGLPVFAGGLSMGGSLTLRLAELHGDRLRGILLVNPAIKDDKPHGFLAQWVHPLVPTVGTIGSDISKPDVRESTTDRTPLAAYAALRRGWKTTRAELARVTVPVRLFTSAQDHVVNPRASAIVQSGVSSERVEATTLLRSYHVATLDWDAPLIFSESVEFIRSLLAEEASGV